jgi:hypothetical protein
MVEKGGVLHLVGAPSGSGECSENAGTLIIFAAGKLDHLPRNVFSVDNFH